MDPLLLAKSAVMGLVEGLTEFLPVSSTGHLILVGDLLGMNDEKGKVFEIVIQSGAMLAILWEYRARFGRVVSRLASDEGSRRFVTNLLVAFLPAAVVGLALGKVIKRALFKPVPVALAFIVGGLVILWAERRSVAPRVDDVDRMNALDALKVGLAQCFALIPGTSRAGATIIGGMLFGLSRQAATEFSFFLAVPTLVAAGAWDLYKNRALFDAGDLPMMGVGCLVAFLSAFVCVRWLIRWVASHDFTIFAWYRIAFGLAVLGTAQAGWVRWTLD